MTPEWSGALKRGDVGELQRLIDAGADVNALDRYGQTALMLAARDGQLDVVRLLIERDADLNHTAKYGLSALMLAVIHRRPDVARLLTEAGARQDLRGTGAPGFWQKTALDLAMAQGDADLIDALTT